MKVGVLALQGDFLEHRLVLQRLGIQVVEVRLPEHLQGLEGLIIPGGESTAIGKLATSYELMDPLQDFAREHPIWGTCAGAIFLSKDVHREQPLLKLMDIRIERNAFGRQIDSFVTHLEVPALEEPEMPFEAVFIRAPLIESVGEDVQVLAQLPQDGVRQANIVAARQGHLLATSFHPELTEDDRFHRYFLALVRGGES